MLRRAFIGSALLTGLTPPRPDQAHSPPQQSTVAPGGKAVIVAREIIIVGSTGGMFIYSPTRALGNLIASDTAAAGTDIYGNPYLQGDTTYDQVNHIAQQSLAGELSWWTSTGTGQPWTQGTNVIGIGGSTLQYLTSLATWVGQGPSFFFPQDPGNVGSFPIVPETPHTLGAFGTAGLTFTKAHYWLTNEGLLGLDIQGSCTAGGGVVAGSNSFAATLSSPYLTNTQRQVPALMAATGTGMCQITTGGSVRLQFPALSSGNVIGVSTEFRLD